MRLDTKSGEYKLKYTTNIWTKKIKMKRKHIVVIYYNDNKAIPTNTYVKYEAKKKPTTRRIVYQK